MTSTCITCIHSAQEGIDWMMDTPALYGQVLQPQGTLSLADDEVVGFRRETRSIKNQLRGGSRRLQIIPIVGMPGIGKTTLATQIYNDPDVRYLFLEALACCRVSQVMDERNVLIELLNQLGQRERLAPELTEDDLANELRRSLLGKRYLIFLDDVWSIEQWNRLASCFPDNPDDPRGSRIILTTRHYNAAPANMLHHECRLSELSREESLDLLQEKLFSGNGWPAALSGLGTRIAESCHGLPLALVIVAGVLATVEERDWEQLLEGLSSRVISMTDSFELSYRSLPDYLKPCLLYFGALRDFDGISVRRLLQLWVAEGFVLVPNGENRSLEDIGKAYLKDLINRSLITVAKGGSYGGVKACRAHALLHEFCLQKARDIDFSHLLGGYGEHLELNEPLNTSRLSLSSEQSELSCPRARSLAFGFSQNIENSEEPDQVRGPQMFLDLSFMVHISRLVRVLDLEKIHLGLEFPCQIELLDQLVFLAIRGRLRFIPPSIASLLNLETLIVDAIDNEILLPDSLWDLRKLKHLYVRSDYAVAGGTLLTENLDSSLVSDELESISGAIIPSSALEMVMEKFPNVRKLKCKLSHSEGSATDEFMASDFLGRLDSLDMSPYAGVRSSIRFAFLYPANLKKLTLSHFFLPWTNISTIGKLENLQVLKLLGISFEGDTWEMEEGDFANLTFLKLSSLDLVKWRDSDDQFPFLEKLVLNECRRLEELPACLESMPTLQMIEISHCSRAVVNQAMVIQRGQKDISNADFRLKIS